MTQIRLSHKAAYKMAIDFDILDAIPCPSDFRPNDKQIALKLKLFKYVSVNILSKLTADTIHLVKQAITPFTLDTVKDWIDSSPGFLDWLLLPDVHEVKLFKAKEQAVDALVDILNLRETDDKTLALKMKAADIILKSEKTVSKTVNNLTLPAGIPKELQGKSTEALTEELRRLKE